MPGTGKIRALADYFRIRMSDLTDLKENQDPDIEFGDVVTKIEQSDPRFKRIILEYDNLPLDKKICYVIFLRSLFSTLEKAK